MAILKAQSVIIIQSCCQIPSLIYIFSGCVNLVVLALSMGIQTLRLGGHKQFQWISMLFQEHGREECNLIAVDSTFNGTGRYKYPRMHMESAECSWGSLFPTLPILRTPEKGFSSYIPSSFFFYDRKYFVSLSLSSSHVFSFSQDSIAGMQKNQIRHNFLIYCSQTLT